MSSSTSVPPNSPPVAGESRRREGEREASDMLPSELWAEVLVRLSVRSLLTLKCVSRSFFSLIQNPNFVCLHFSIFNSCYSQSKGSDLLLLGREFAPSFIDQCWDYFLVRRSCTPIQTSEFKFRVHCGDHCEVVGNFRGLLLLRRYTSSSKDMILCNPSIRKCLVLPPSPSSDLGVTKLGFGYDPVTNDYKVVSIVYVKDEPLNPESQDQVEASPRALIEVYSLRAASWRTIGFDAMCRGWFLESCVYANGCLHWIAGLDKYYNGLTSRTDDYYLSHIVSFDLGTEMFSCRELPDLNLVYHVDIEVKKLLVLYHGLPAVFRLLAHQIFVWVMGESDWTKECQVESVPEVYCYLLDESEISRICSATFSQESNEIMATGYHGMVSYNIETQQLMFGDRSVSYVGNCVESLLWIESLPSLDLAEGSQELTNTIKGTLETGGRTSSWMMQAM